MGEVQGWKQVGLVYSSLYTKFDTAAFLEDYTETAFWWAPDRDGFAVYIQNGTDWAVVTCCPRGEKDPPDENWVWSFVITFCLDVSSADQEN
ncbi:hypothetical protein OBV_04690 [Oscillibacter valericigenes Sjm18-20]|nr:hypothetical protein OBV_04690 [Oscillibacter valericigenes Sjm18-20]